MTRTRRSIRVTLGAALLGLGVASGSALADEGPTKPTRDEDLQLATNYFRQFVYAMKTPMTFYHWFDSGGGDRKWSSRLSAKDPAGYAYVRDGTHTFWRTTGGTAHGNSYGPGLYVATDPVATANYGKRGNSTSSWVLVQMRTPAGFRLLDLQRDGSGSIPITVGNALIRVGCPRSWIRDNHLLNTLMAPKPNVSPDCVSAIREIFDGALHLDAFAYPYPGTDYQACKARKPPDDGSVGDGNGPGAGNPFHKSALVITSDRWLSPDRVRIFNHLTDDDWEDRLTIESLFYKATAEYERRGIGNVAPALPYPTPMSLSTHLGTNASDLGSKLLWKDLDGAVTDPHLDQWIVANLLGCQEGLPYVDLPTLSELLTTACSKSDIDDASARRDKG